MSAPLLVGSTRDFQTLTSLSESEEKSGEVMGHKITPEPAKLPFYIQVPAQVYQLNVNPDWKDFIDLSVENLTEIVRDLNVLYEVCGNEAGGYKLRLVVLARQQRTIQVLFETYGARELGHPMKMPKMPEKPEECAFCKSEEMPGYEKARRATSHVMQSKEGNPLTIANQHFSHFFVMGLEEQRDLLATIIQVVKINMDLTGEFSRYEIVFHSGVEGGQTYGHVHGHVLAALGRKEKDSKQIAQADLLR